MRKLSRTQRFIVEQGMYTSFMIALVATTGSLYLSEVLGYIPCEFCWFQRIFMYPLVILLGIAAVRKDLKQSIYVIPLTIIGMGLAAYHYMLQKVPGLAEVGKACGLIPCNVDYLNWFGIITIPMMAFVAFSLIFVIQIMIIWTVKQTHT
jgi:disulfide bond formation protein DsbB